MTEYLERCYTGVWKGIIKKLVRVKSMYDGWSNDNSENQTRKHITVGLVYFSPLLFIIVMDAVSEYVWHDVRWDRTRWKQVI